MHRTGGKPSWADMCRQRAADAKQRAAQARDLSVKRAFEEVAAGWLVLAEQTERMDSKEGSPPQRKKKSLRRDSAFATPQAPNDHLGSKPEKLRTSKCFPVCPRKRTYQPSIRAKLFYNEALFQFQEADAGLRRQAAIAKC